MLDPKMARLREVILARSMPEPNSGCWLWLKSLDPKGYGQITYILGTTKKLYRAHRLSYLAFKGEIPKGLELDHLCRVTWCVNPEHLEPVTHRINMLRGMRFELQTHCKRGHPLSGNNVIVFRNGKRTCRACKHINDAAWRERNRKPPVPRNTARGERIGAAKLTEIQVRTILASPRPTKDFATEFGVSMKAIQRIKARQAWKHLEILGGA